MASSLSLWFSIQSSPRCSWRSIWCNEFSWCICWDLMNCEFMIRSIYEYYLSLLWTLICMILIASYIFLLRNFGLVWPTRFFLAMGRGALWWVRSWGAQSQWQKETWHACIVAIKDNKMGSIPTWIDLVYIMSSFLLHHSVSPWT